VRTIGTYGLPNGTPDALPTDDMESRKTRRTEPLARRVNESMLSASARVLEASVNLLADRIDLARAEVEGALDSTASRAARVVAAGALFFSAWALAIAAGVSALVAIGVPVAVGIGAGALVCAGTGAGLLAVSRRTSGLERGRS